MFSAQKQKQKASPPFSLFLIRTATRIKSRRRTSPLPGAQRIESLLAECVQKRRNCDSFVCVCIKKCSSERLGRSTEATQAGCCFSAPKTHQCPRLLTSMDLFYIMNLFAAGPFTLFSCCLAVCPTICCTSKRLFKCSV